jgi:hypothetical protein
MVPEVIVIGGAGRVKVNKSVVLFTNWPWATSGVWAPAAVEYVKLAVASVRLFGFVPPRTTFVIGTLDVTVIDALVDTVVPVHVATAIFGNCSVVPSNRRVVNVALTEPLHVICALAVLTSPRPATVSANKTFRKSNILMSFSLKILVNRSKFSAT